MSRHLLDNGTDRPAKHDQRVAMSPDQVLQRTAMVVSIIVGLASLVVMAHNSRLPLRREQTPDGQ